MAASAGGTAVEDALFQQARYKLNLIAYYMCPNLAFVCQNDSVLDNAHLTSGAFMVKNSTTGLSV